MAPPERDCADVESRLIEAFLAREEPQAADAAHAEGCAGCGGVRAELRALAAALDAHAPPTLRPELAAAVRARAARELAPPAALPPGYGRELARLLAWAAAPLPLLALWYALLFERGGELLARFLPATAVAAIGFVFAAGTLSWLAAIYGAIPFVAHYRARRRWEESTA